VLAKSLSINEDMNPWFRLIILVVRKVNLRPVFTKFAETSRIEVRPAKLVLLEAGE